jgi:hypothetical protein
VSEDIGFGIVSAVAIVVFGSLAAWPQWMVRYMKWIESLGNSPPRPPEDWTFALVFIRIFGTIGAIAACIFEALFIASLIRG